MARAFWLDIEVEGQMRKKRKMGLKIFTKSISHFTANLVLTLKEKYEAEHFKKSNYDGEISLVFHYPY